MKRTKKLLACGLALVLCLGCIGIVSAEVSITWLGYYTSNITVSEDTYAEKLLEETFGIEIIPVTDVSQENMDVFISSGDILDITCYPSYLDNSFAYMYDQDLIREFPAEWLYEYYPNGMKVYEDFLGKEFFEEGNHLIDGKCLFIPFTTTTNTSQLSMLYRKDWMENLGMTEPTTLDEFHDLLYAFTFGDPDGNGKKDTYGIDPIFAWAGLWPVYGAFGFTNNWSNGSFYLQDDGSVTYTAVSDAYKQALAIVKEWYDEGIIDPNCITDDRSAARTKWANGTVGAMGDSQTWFYSNRGSSSIAAMVQEPFGENSVDVLGALTYQYGDGNVYSSANYPSVRNNRAICFTADTTDEQIIAVLTMLDGMVADHDLMLKVMFGEEGIDYTMSEDGQLQVNSDVSIEHMASKGIGDTFYGYGATDPYITSVTFSEQDKAFIDKCNSWPMLFTGANFTTMTNEAYDTYFAEVKKLEGEFYHGVLLGTVELESGWNTYVDNMNKAGLDKILIEYAEHLSK